MILIVYLVLAPFLGSLIRTSIAVIWMRFFIVTWKFSSGGLISIYRYSLSIVWILNWLYLSRSLGLVNPPILSFMDASLAVPVSPKTALLHVTLTKGCPTKSVRPVTHFSPRTSPLGRILWQLVRTSIGLVILTPFFSSMDSKILKNPPSGTAWYILKLNVYVYPVKLV